MEIPAILYFSCWSLIAITFLELGFIALDKDKSQISPIIVFLLKRFLAIAVCHSSAYALVHRTQADKTSTINHLNFSVLGFPFLLYVYIVSGPIPLTQIFCYACFVAPFLSIFLIRMVDLGFFSTSWSDPLTFSLTVQNDTFFPAFVLVCAFVTATMAAMLDETSPNSNGRTGPGLDPGSVQKSSRKRKIAERAAAILASVAFQVVVRFTSFCHVVAFLCFAVTWLGCLALTVARSDFGVFDLLVCNVLIGCVNGFGLSGPTWFAYGASVVLFVLHPKVQALRFCMIVMLFYFDSLMVDGCLLDSSD